MESKRKLLIVTRDQFGYHVDTYEYAKNLKTLYDITYFCWDYGQPKISLDGVNIIYSSRQGNMITRNLRLRIHLLKTIRQGYDHILLKYFLGVSVVHLFARQRSLVCDIRTANVTYSRWRRVLFDSLMFLELMTFRYITIISDCLAKKLHLKNYQVLPLGGVKIPIKDKDLREFRLLYVGTFDGRKLSDTVRGFKIFYEKHKNTLACSYTIIGTGLPHEVNQLRNTIVECELQGVIDLPGYIPHDELIDYLQKSNIGISYVPITGFFDCQPPTKTYEYLLGGMPVLATSTKENVRLVNDINGVLIKDNVKSVAEGLENLYKNRLKYRSVEIQKSMEPYIWENIVKNQLHQYLNNIYMNTVHGSTRYPNRKKRI